jgi:putative nucleotidyltransferase with HDIG domain
MMTAEEKANEVFGLYEKYGATEYHGEPVSQLEHMFQSAVFAEDFGYDDDVVLAAFFHDIGYFLKNKNYAQMNGFGHTEHEKIGAAYLRDLGFSEKICRLILEHVNAKRYLCYKYADYYNNLSEASKNTLTFQGGPMNESEAMTYENDPLFDTIIQMRKWDEAAKEVNISISSEFVEQLKAIALNHLKAQAI